MKSSLVGNKGAETVFPDAVTAAVAPGTGGAGAAIKAGRLLVSILALALGCLPLASPAALAGQAPRIDSMSVSQGGAGTVVNLRGSGLVGIRAVTFGGTPADFRDIHPTFLGTVVPKGASDGEILVVTDQGVASAGVFNVFEPPEVTSMSNDKASAGDTVTISGRHLRDVTAVWLGADTPLSFSSVSDSEIVFEVPRESPKYGHVKVASPYGAADAGALTIEPAPEVGPEPLPAGGWASLDWAGALTPVLENFSAPAYSFILGDANGILFSYEKGGASVDDVKLVASYSKWLASAVILSMVEQGVMSLDDSPQQYIDWWTDDPADPRSRITLSQLLSFTSGFALTDQQANCSREWMTAADDCAREIYRLGIGHEPGTTFEYGRSHLQIAALMAELASGQKFSSLMDLVLSQPLGMGSTGFPDASAPALNVAGGMRSSASDTARFLQAILDGSLLPGMRQEWEADRTGAEVQTLPSGGINLGWHYAMGHWRECAKPQWDESCDSLAVVSSPGVLGWYPWVDFATGLYGLVALQVDPRSLQGDAALASIELGNAIRAAVADVLTR